MYDYSHTRHNHGIGIEQDRPNFWNQISTTHQISRIGDGTYKNERCTQNHIPIATNFSIRKNDEYPKIGK